MALPPELAARFTTGQLAVLRIVADECRDKGHCDLTREEIAVRASTSRKTVHTAIQGAAALGLVLMSRGAKGTNVSAVLTSPFSDAADRRV